MNQKDKTLLQHPERERMLQQNKKNPKGDRK